MREVYALLGFCGFVVLASFAALVRGLLSGEGLTLDTLLLVAICLSVATLFGGVALWFAWDAGLLDSWKARLQRKANPDKKPEAK
jgi:hypothetical protein